MPPISPYGVLSELTRELFEAFQRQGIISRLLIAQRESPQPFLESIFSNPPECTLSFNGLLPGDKGDFFCDMIKIPHIACLLDSPNHYLLLTHSKRNIITCCDLFYCHFFLGMNFKNVLFMPPGVGKDVAPDPKLERRYDVVFLSSCIDFEQRREKWKKNYSSGLNQALNNAAEMALSDAAISYFQAFVQVVNEQAGTKEAVDPTKIDYIEILDELELFIRGKDRYNLIKAIKDAKVDIFGSGRETKGWSQYLGDQCPNITIHDPVPYEEALNIMKQSKIVLNSTPHIRNGGHERLFAAMACGSLVITNENIYLNQQNFIDGEHLAFYQYNQWEEVNERVNAYLSNENQWRAITEKAREKVMNGHTWDHRVVDLLEQLPGMLKEINKS